MAQIAKRTYRYRFHPTVEQADELARTFGCVRLVYNRALEERTRVYTLEGRRVSYTESSAALTRWKKTPELAFLGAVSSVPLQQALRHLQAAFANFFARRARYPAFKSRKRSRLSAEYTRSAFRWRDGRLTLAKMDAPLEIVWSRPLPEGAEPSTVTVSRDAVGRWFVCILVEETIRPLEPITNVVGVDAGIIALMTLSTGEKVANPRHERRDRRTRLVRENQTVVIEDLAVRNLVKNRRVARAISDASWRQMRSMLEYKAAWYGRELVVIDRWFPSSKLCSACGALRGEMPLDVRDWRCACGARHDRDVNAAENILAAGPAER
ncbi:IS200/IS605 family element transposase accessory protein TnpB [Nonomuraea sp. SMC257]|uniref:IS200/IS605 family element transposase accessory protein TnpB n=1 Tax=Nonomuraea montanisoli TaxID=2741721 RepID=A0A7Y6I922_9ACTN|nr:IS200/IS605 family element transposase accessory protein TnpB [Nonomuraea montanisoli]